MKDIDPLFDEEIEPIEPEQTETAGKKKGKKNRLRHRKQKHVPPIARPALNKAVQRYLDNGGKITIIETELEGGWLSTLN